MYKYSYCGKHDCNDRLRRARGDAGRYDAVDKIEQAQWEVRIRNIQQKERVKTAACSCPAICDAFTPTRLYLGKIASWALEPAAEM